MRGKIRLIVGSLMLVFALATAGFIATANAADAMDCPISLQKDGKSWTRQGSGWIRTVPAPGGGTDSFALANYESNTPVETKTYNCSTGNWDVPPL